MRGMEQLALPLEVVTDHDREIDLLTSFGVLSKNNGCVSFAHQSFFDFFSIRGQIDLIYAEGKHLPELYSDPDKQTPDVRYQLLMLLQYLMETDRRVFLRECGQMLRSGHIHTYFQCYAFDVIGQMEEPDDGAWALV